MGGDPGPRISAHTALRLLGQSVADRGRNTVFYHPSIWYVSNRMRIEREYCTDELATKIYGDTTQYASALTQLEENAAVSTLAMAANGGILLNRIRRILGLPADDVGRTGSWLVGAAVSVALLLMLIAIPTVRASLQLAAAPSVEIRRIWADKHTTSSGRISPDGKHVAFIHWDSGNLGLYSLEDGARRLLTSEGTWQSPNAYAESPVWSPDSSRVAYTWIVNERPQVRVVSIDTPATDPVALYAADSMGWTYARDWAPDGKSILADVKETDGELNSALISVADGSQTRLANMPNPAGAPKFSPDGQLLAFMQRTENRDRDIFLYDINTTQTRPVVEHPGDDRSPQWSPDGKWLTFVSTRSGTNAVWMLRVGTNQADQDPVPVATLGANHRVFGISNDGKYYFGRSQLGTDVFSVDYNAATHEIQGQERILVNRFLGRNWQSAWSPDGERLAFFSVRSSPAGGHSPYLIVRDEQQQTEQYSDLGFVARWYSPLPPPPWPGCLIASRMRFTCGRYFDWMVCENMPSAFSVTHRATVRCPPHRRPMRQVLQEWTSQARAVISFFSSGVRWTTWNILGSCEQRPPESDGELVTEIPEPLLQVEVAPDETKLIVAGLHALWLVDLSSNGVRELYRVANGQSQSLGRGVAWTRDSQFILVCARRTVAPTGSQHCGSFPWPTAKAKPLH